MRLLTTIDDAKLQAALLGYPARLQERLVRTMNRLTVQLQGRVKEKLSGEVLHVRTGTLRRSINREVLQTAKGVTGIVGTNVEYAAAHEYGFHGTVVVKAHLRKIRSTGRNGRLGKVTGVTTVKAHTRNVNLPERSFLRSALKELLPQVNRDIQQATLDALVNP